METRKDGLQNSAQYEPLTADYDATPRTHRPAEKEEVRRARELVLTHGWNSTSFQIINPGIRRWFSASGDAVVGYVTDGGVRVVVGAPVCPGDRLPDVVAEFEADSRSAGENICYFAAESRLESLIRESDKHTRFSIGAQPCWDPFNWASKVAKDKSLRSQINRSRNKNVIVTEWPASAADRHPELKACLDEWLATKGLPPLHFMVEPDTLGRLAARRVFVAERHGQIIGFVVLSPITGRNGWLFEQFPHRPSAPNGTVELMIDAAMRALAADGVGYATLGLSPLSDRGGAETVDEPVWLRWLLHAVRQYGRRFYNFKGLDAFKAKLRPDGWEPVFAVSRESRVSFRTLYAIAAAFSGGRPFRFVASALVRAVVQEIRWVAASGRR